MPRGRRVRSRAGGAGSARRRPWRRRAVHGPLEHRHLRHLLALWRTPASSRRSSPRRSGWSQPRPQLPAVRHSSPATRVSPRWHPASRTGIRPHCGIWWRSSRATPDDLARRLAELLAAVAVGSGGDSLGGPSRRCRALELGERLAQAARALRLTPPEQLVFSTAEGVLSSVQMRNRQPAPGGSLSNAPVQLPFSARWATNSTFPRSASP